MNFSDNIFIQQGIIDCQIDQLINYSNTDPQIKKFTSDPVRFKDLNSFRSWLSKGRIIYTLTDKNSNLLGIIWFGEKEAPFKTTANFTFAIRLYGVARGQGLSQKFMKNVFNDLLSGKNKDRVVGFWLETSIKNLSAIHVYEKFGFKKEKVSKKSVFMSLSI